MILVNLGVDKHHIALHSVAMCHYGQSGYIDLFIGVQSLLKSWSPFIFILKKKESQSLACPIGTKQIGLWWTYHNVHNCTYTNILNREFVSQCSDQIVIQSGNLSTQFYQDVCFLSKRALRSRHLKYVSRDLTVSKLNELHTDVLAPSPRIKA